VSVGRTDARLFLTNYHSPPSNPQWGYRDTDDITRLAEGSGLELVALEEMPANNFQLVYRKT
jgi:hypothetical protein